jgi:Domain of unknown function (DUF4180)
MAEFEGVRVYIASAEGPKLGTGRDAVELISAAMARHADWVALPATRLQPAFFQLRTGMAGEFVQKFATYRLGLAICGDFHSVAEKSTALGDFVREANRGNTLWFAADIAELEERLRPLGPLCRC